MKTITTLSLVFALSACGAGASGTQVLAGDSVCVGFDDSGAPSAVVNAGGTTIVVPLMKSRDAGE